MFWFIHIFILFFIIYVKWNVLWIVYYWFWYLIILFICLWFSWVEFCYFFCLFYWYFERIFLLFNGGQRWVYFLRSSFSCSFVEFEFCCMTRDLSTRRPKCLIDVGLLIHLISFQNCSWLYMQQYLSVY